MCSIGRVRRILYSLIALVVGNSILFLYFMYGAWMARTEYLAAHLDPAGQIPRVIDMFVLYAIFSFIGWVLVGIPVVLASPAGLIARLAWPLWIPIGAVLGPLALLLILLLMEAGRGQFSLANTETLWPLSIVVSTVSFVVYGALLRRRIGASTPQP